MSRTAVVHVSVETKDHEGNVIPDHPYTWEQTVAKRGDEFRDLIGDGNARASVSLSERIGGPYGYSSVSVQVSVSINCNQDADTIRKAEDLAFREALAFLDDTMDHAHRALVAHLERLYREG